ncbi:DMT family transporter [Rivibacter subsaxonicus]|uniref:Drug/metabolite transporter (DMT)-like permease n=1 Tax=Rivibacter subsaxonicus TaxID=457575 RepID=A0A4Q7V7E7_9BURK|nr:DMT family transporter [Rivibacter subsaxonicus]RZT92556.1 drug/metabolite transporter (DMT)-like permease [Rivibacter subsaxonicus]
MAERPSRWLASMPALFVLIWSTGFVVARYGMPHAPPFKFLALRFALSIACFALWMLLARVRLPSDRAQLGHLAVTGVLMHAGYLGGVWAAVKLGIGAGTVALLVGLQPLLTAVWLSASLGVGAVRPRQWAGLACGVAGLLLVVGPRLGAGEVNAANLGLALLALLSISAGTLYQKHYLHACDVRAASLVQLLAALVVMLPLAWLEQEPMHWHPELVGALAWSVLVLTLGGSSLLYMLIQRGAATEVTSLLYLVPPCTALMAWALFGESLGPLVLAGLALSATGVALVVRGASTR